MSSKSNLALAMANLSAMQSQVVATTGQPLSKSPLAPPVAPEPTTPSGEKETVAEEGGKSNTMLYVGIGVGVVILIVVAYFIFRK